MASDYVQHVYGHPPRCIAALNPKPTRHPKPTLPLPPDLTIYWGGLHPTDDIASFLIGCPCGNRAVYLLGYYVSAEARRADTVFVGPLGLECAKCETISAFFDTRNHGFDGEQGVNTHIVGEGKPERFACPRCGAMPMFVCANFCYQIAEQFDGKMRERLQDFFDTLDIVVQCTQCDALVEVTSFECA